MQYSGHYAARKLETQVEQPTQLTPEADLTAFQPNSVRAGEPIVHNIVRAVMDHGPTWGELGIGPEEISRRMQRLGGKMLEGEALTHVAYFSRQAYTEGQRVAQIRRTELAQGRTKHQSSNQGEL